MGRISNATGMRMRHVATIAVFVGCSIVLTACASGSGPKVTHVAKAKSKEYFAEAEYGVKASPRVIASAGSKVRLPRGGGREQVGKPYKVRGKWYVPKLDPMYQATGTASWYGDAFHGRLTANGEIYDMNHLSAAHPTMPLPSYARVTNLKNGNSVLVRVNDRGPYAHNRLVDLSKRAAQLLDYTQSGTAQVKLEYVGPAPVHGQDDQYLMASYQPGSGGLPVNPGQVPVMVASAQMPADPALPGVNAFAGEIPDATAQRSLYVARPRAAVASPAMAPMGAGDMPTMPAMTVTPAERPQTCITLEPCEDGDLRGMLSGYADVGATHGQAARAFNAMDLANGANSDWKQSVARERILVGTYAASEVKKAKAALNKFAAVTAEANDDGTVEVYVVPVAGKSTDSLLKALWAKGYKDAFVIR